MIDWISFYSNDQGYKPKFAFMSGKKDFGINHKAYGVTSMGINVYMEEILKYLQIDPKNQSFFVKMTGGPDGDVAGNQILNLYQKYPDTAKIIAITDGYGTIYDPCGLSLKHLNDLVLSNKSIINFPVEHLTENGFLLNLKLVKKVGSFTEQTLLQTKKDGIIQDTWLFPSQSNFIYKTFVHKTSCDIFIPAGGRPKTLNENNYTEMLDKEGKPNTKAIIEGANLYLTQKARNYLEARGVLIVKDSSANKTGVICSSYEVLANLILEKEFLNVKAQLILDIFQILKEKALNEAKLLIKTHEQTQEAMSNLSDCISNRINELFVLIMEHLKTINLFDESSKAFLNIFKLYCPKIIQTDFMKEALERIPDIHKKAIIACFISSKIVYTKGINWSPSIIDVLDLLIATFQKDIQ
jgi:glutamate dehydrogenase